MNDKRLYSQILGLPSDWAVEEVLLDIEREEVDIDIIYNPSSGVCPECESACSIYDYRTERRWRHLDTCQMRTYISCKIPRIKCSEHGVKTMSVPWAESLSRTTLLFERFAIDVLEASKNQTKVSKLLRVSFDTLHHIMTKAVNRGLSRRKDVAIQSIGIDEKSMKKGHHYLSVLSDTDNARVLDVSEGRTTDSALSLLHKGLTKQQRSGIVSVSMDMWQAFIKATRTELPRASIVHDRFHIVKYLNEAVDKTRRLEASQFHKRGDKTLDKTRYIFLKNAENMTDKQRTRFEKIQELNLNTSQAWVAKENFRAFFKCGTVSEAKFFFAQWYEDVTRRSLTKMIKVGKMLISHFEGLLNYITHPVNNATAEWVNGQIQEIKTVGRGFRAFKNYRIAILFFLGKLDLYPQQNL